MSTPILYLEPVGGIAGDMFLSALVELGVDPKALETQLRTLKLDGWVLKFSKATRHSIVGTHLDVQVAHAPRDDHHHGPSADHHHHDDGHDHRAYADIEKLISASGLSARAKADALRVFRVIGEAEARVHGVPMEKIHFHEVGAVDSIIDVCGAAVALELLGHPRVFCAPPPLGSGTIKIAHGEVPVPVPATLEILRGVPVRHEGVGECTTPTGAAIVKAFTTVEPPPEMMVDRVGYGMGTKDTRDRANTLRATLGRTREVSEAVFQLETNLDDCSPQLLGAVFDRLLAVGALDVWVMPVTMKKGRPGHVLSALAPAPAMAAVQETLLRETTSLGVRSWPVSREILERTHVHVSTPWGPVRMKLGIRSGTTWNATPEFEDCRAVAEKASVPLKDVLAAAVASWSASKK